jgi:hypothetical protein
MLNQRMSRQSHSHRTVASLLTCAAFSLCSAFAHDPPPAREPSNSSPQAKSPATPPADLSIEEKLARLNEGTMKALDAKDYPTAERLLKEQLALEETFITLYNLACVRALQGDAKDAFSFLERSIDKGFITRSEMETDPMLESVRALPEYTALLGRWAAKIDAHKERGLRLAREQFPDAKQSAIDEHLRLTYANAFHEHSFEAARAELTKLSEWAQESVFPDLFDPETSRDDAWVVVILPSQKDFRSWAVRMFGPEITQGFSTVGGSYSNDEKRLVAQDLGPTLRHEFFHVLHWRSMTRLNQRHPTWVQEGLCSLVEDYDVIDGKLSPSTSWRTNTVQRMKSANVLLPIRQLVTRTSDHFRGQRRMGMYAQSRAVFLYLWQKGKLKDWYARYTLEYAEDPTGLLSLERTVGLKAEDFDKDFRKWASELDLVPEEMRTGMATLGVEVDTGTGEGPVVLSFQKRPQGPTQSPPRGPVVRKPEPSTPASKPWPGPNSPTPNSNEDDKADRLQPGDVITSINGQPVRDLPELLRRMGQLKPGQIVPITIRRVKLIKTIDVPLGEYQSNSK